MVIICFLVGLTTYVNTEYFRAAILESVWDDDGGELVRDVSWSFWVNKTRWIWVAQSIIEMWSQCFDVAMIIYNRVYCIASAATLSRTAIYYSIP